MCNPEPTTLAEYCRESVAASVLTNYQEQVMLPGATEKQAAEMAPMYDNEVKFKWSEAEYQARKAAKEWSESTIGEYELQTVETSAQVQTKSILAEADEITSVDRNKTYGPPRDNHVRTAQLWNAYISGKRGMPLNYRDVCWLNLLQKASRDVFCPGRDNIVDAAGYLRNIEMADNDEGR